MPRKRIFWPHLESSFQCWLDLVQILKSTRHDNGILEGVQCHGVVKWMVSVLLFLLETSGLNKLSFTLSADKFFRSGFEICNTHLTRYSIAEFLLSMEQDANKYLKSTSIPSRKL
jgi:hypothetical protein